MAFLATVKACHFAEILCIAGGRIGLGLGLALGLGLGLAWILASTCSARAFALVGSCIAIFRTGTWTARTVALVAFRAALVGLFDENWSFACFTNLGRHGLKLSVCMAQLDLEVSVPPRGLSLGLTRLLGLFRLLAGVASLCRRIQRE